MQHELGERWASSNYKQRAIINGFFDGAERVQGDTSVENILDTLVAIKASDRVDSDGLTANALCLLGFACVDVVTEIVKCVLAS